MGLEKQSGRGWGCAAGSCREGGLEGAAAKANITRNSAFTLITTGAIFYP